MIQIDEHLLGNGLNITNKQIECHDFMFFPTPTGYSMPDQPAAYGTRLGSEVREQKLQNSVQATRAQRENSKTYGS